MVADNDYKKMKTSEIINAADSVDTESVDSLYEELNEREVVRYLQDQIRELREQLNGQQIAIDKLKRHQHGQDGEVLVRL